MAKPKTTLAAALAALFPKSEKAVSEKLTQDEFNTFGAEVQEAHDRIDAQTEGNQAVSGDLTQAQADLATANTSSETANGEVSRLTGELATANSTIASLKPNAEAWTAHKAALDGLVVGDDSTNVKPGQKSDNGLSAKDQAHVDEKARLKAKYPGLMADIEVAVQE